MACVLFVFFSLWVPVYGDLYMDQVPGPDALPHPRGGVHFPPWRRCPAAGDSRHQRITRHCFKHSSIDIVIRRHFGSSTRRSVLLRAFLRIICSYESFRQWLTSRKWPRPCISSKLSQRHCRSTLFFSLRRNEAS